MKIRSGFAALMVVFAFASAAYFYSIGRKSADENAASRRATTASPSDSTKVVTSDHQATEPEVFAPPQPAHPVTLQDRYGQSNNLGELVNELRADADAGSADAIRVIANAYNECLSYFLSPELLETAHIDNAFDESDRSIALRFQKKQLQRCAELIANSGPDYSKRRDAAVSRTIGLNDLVGQAEQLRVENGKKMMDPKSAMSDDETVVIARKIALSGDPQAIAALAGSQSRPGERGRSDTYAWVLVACNFGRDCSADGLSMRRNCLEEGRCVDGTYRELLRRKFLPPDAFDAAQIREREILEAIKKGDVSKIIP